MIKYFKDWNSFEKAWLAVFTVITLSLFFARHDTWIGLTASLTGMFCVVLTAKGRISSFYFGLINILTYSYVAYKSAYYGDVMLNMLFFLPTTFIGIINWRKNLSKEAVKTVIVQRLSRQQKANWFLLSLAATVVYGLFLHLINGTLPFIDSITTIFSIAATLLLINRYTFQWFFWIMVDVWSIVMWAYIFLRDGNEISVLVMWAAFLVNAIYGYFNWRKIERRQYGR